jgi:flagellar assembly factor FliW
MKVETREWGVIEVADDSVIQFQEGLLGFENLCKFIFVETEEFKPFVWFLSTDDPDVGFAVADPFYFTTNPYELNLSESDDKALGLEEGDSIAVFVVVSIEDMGRKITGNLKGPIVLNTRTRKAKQMVMYGSAFSVHQPILSRRIVPLQNAVAGSSAKPKIVA